MTTQTRETDKKERSLVIVERHISDDINKPKFKTYFAKVTFPGTKKVKLINPSKNLIHNRQKAPKTFDMNASIYIWKKKSLFKTNNLFNKKTSIFVMPLERSIDIDSDFDLKLVKKLWK